MEHEVECEFCTGREHGRTGGRVGDNPYPTPTTLTRKGPYWLWHLGFLVGEMEYQRGYDGDGTTTV